MQLLRLIGSELLIIMGAATDSARAIFLPVLVFVLFQGIDCQQQQLYAFNGTASCSDAYKFPNGSTMGKSIQILLANLLRDAPSTSYKESNQGSIGDTVYGLLQCRGDLSQQECKSCAQSAATVLNDTCVRNSTKGGRVFLGPCFLRYEDHFFASTLDTVSNQVNCSTGAKTATFDSNLALALSFIKNKVPTSPKKFTATVGGAASRSPAYVLGQCTPSLSSLDCASCLDQAQTVLATTCGSSDGGICLYPTCTLQFQNSKFFEGTAENATTTGGGKSSSRIALAIALPVGVIGLLLVSALGLWCVWKKRRKQLKPAPTGELDELHATLNRGPVTFSYELLRHATDDFGDAHKLGEGGFGAVYKGTFADGTELAIKKLSVVSKQGEIQFLNEVKTISNVQHRNLVKLLGCCVQGTERLLVYEFLKNNSLEKALFDEKSGLQLSWETRYNILLGTARGLTYLHEDSQVRIIHRDIKPSNILLDEFFEAKISDFGLARLHGEDEASEVITTKVAGTYGYMAPEYAFHGHLSEKADVFSFGILMLETVSGRKIRDISLPGEEQYLLEWAWQLHGNGMLLNLLDPKLIQGHSEPEKSLAEAVHIGLMCTQGSAQARPTMSHVVAMLSGHSNVQVPHTTSSFDFGALKPMSFSHGGTSSSAASSDSKQKRNLSESFSSRPEPR